MRLGAETVAAEGQVLTDLLRMAAKVPFDDRIAREFTVDDLRATLVREFLRETRSALVDEPDDHVHADRIEVTSYPGPVPGLRADHFEQNGKLPAVVARNRRIGELFKELRMAEARGTGIRKIRKAMAENGSPSPSFEFDEARTYFTVVLPIHPSAAPPPAKRASATGRDGLVLVAVGSESIRPTVETSVAGSELAQARILVDLAEPDYVESGHWQAISKRIRNALRRSIEEPGIERLHLFYYGPLAIAPLLGALLASSARPVLVYHYEKGWYVPAYTIDRRFLKAKD